MRDDRWRSSTLGWVRRLAMLGGVLLGAGAQAAGGEVAVEVMLHGVPVTVRASTELADPKSPGRYSPTHLLDDDPHTIWAEGAKGTGAGEWVELSFPPGTPVYAFLVTPGNPKSAKLYQANARPRKAKLELKLAEGRQLDYVLEFPRNFPAGGAIYVAYRREWAVESARLTVLSVWPGSKYRDLCLGTFVPVLRGPEQDKLMTFRGSGKELAPTLSTFIRYPGLVTDLLPTQESGRSAWLRAYPEVPHAGPLPPPELEIDLSNSALFEWTRYLRPLSEDVAGARSQGDLFRLTPGTGETGYVLDPLSPPKNPDAFSNFRARWSRINEEWRVIGLDLKFREESPD
jgi:hypothetical protein